MITIAFTREELEELYESVENIRLEILQDSRKPDYFLSKDERALVSVIDKLERKLYCEQE